MSADVATDCRSDEGVTVGLIDSLIFIARVLAKRDLSAPAVVEALRDLGGDEDFRAVWARAGRPCERSGCAETVVPNAEHTCAVCGGHYCETHLEMITWYGVAAANVCFDCQAGDVDPIQY